MWNFFSLMHAAADEQTDRDAPPYLDTGQMWEESKISEQDSMKDQTSEVEELPSEQQQMLSTTDSSEPSGKCGWWNDGADQTEPMEESKGDIMGEEDSHQKESDKIRTVYSGSGGTEALRLTGLKSPLHRSLIDIPGDETTESLCVEVEDESLSERLQAVESELELLGCCKESTMLREPEDAGPRTKRRRLLASLSVVV